MSGGGNMDMVRRWRASRSGFVVGHTDHDEEHTRTSGNSATHWTGGKRMKRRAIVLLASVLLTVSACAWPLPNGDGGVIGMMPFVSEEMGVSGIAPIGWGQVEPGRFVRGGAERIEDHMELHQKSAPLTLEELNAVLLEQIGLEELPESTGTYEGAALNWDLLTFDTQIDGTDGFTFRLKLALAARESESYFVAVLALPETYDANAPMLDAIFTHALDAFTPVDQSGQGTHSEGQ